MHERVLGTCELFTVSTNKLRQTTKSKPCFVTEMKSHKTRMRKLPRLQLKYAHIGNSAKCLKYCMTVQLLIMVDYLI